MRRLLKGVARTTRIVEDTELKRKVAKEVKSREDDVAYLKNRIAIEESIRQNCQDIIMKMVQCKANLERIEALEKRVEDLEKEVKELRKK